MSNDDNSKPWIRGMALFSMIVMDLVSTTGAGLFLGWFFWKKMGSPQWVILPCTLAGFSLGMYKVFKRSQLQ